jgi:hypothetical protein
MNRTASIRRYWDIHAENELSLYGSRCKFEAENFFFCVLVQVPNELLEQAKAAAQAALEEMDAD